MRIGEIRIELEGAPRRGTGFCDRLFSFFRRKTRSVIGGQTVGGVRQLRIGERVTRVEPDRLLVVADRLPGVLGRAAAAIYFLRITRGLCL